MPSFKNPADPDFHRFDKRYKVWRGVNKTRDPAAIAEEQLVVGTNIRPTVDGYKERGGVDRWTTFPTSGTIEGIHEAGDIGAATTERFYPPLLGAIYMISNAPTDGDWFSYALAATGGTTKVTLPTANVASFARPYSAIGKLMIGTKRGLFGTTPYLYQWDVTSGVTQVYAVPSFFPDSGNSKGEAFYCGVEYGGHFFFSLFYEESSGHVSYPLDHHALIYHWDGLTTPVLELDHTTLHLGPYPGTIANKGVGCTWALYTDGIYIFALQVHTGAEYGIAGNVIKLRDNTTGAWDTLTMPGSCTYFGASPAGYGISYGACVRFDGATYFAGVDSAALVTFSIRTLKILKWDGLTLTEVWNHINTTYLGHINLFVADGVMYYNYSDANIGLYEMGSFDGTTWTDGVKVWSDAPQSVNQIPMNVVEYAGEFWGSALEVSGPGTGFLRKTVSRNITGTWAATGGGDYDGNWLDSENP